jgi:hypothetical protein
MFYEAIALLTCVRDVSGLNLGRDTEYTDLEYTWFYSVPPDVN